MTVYVFVNYANSGISCEYSCMYIYTVRSRYTGKRVIPAHLGMTDFFPISSMIIIVDAPALVYRLRRLISRHKSRIVIDIPAYTYIFPKIAHYDSYLIASNCFYYISMHSH